MCIYIYLYEMMVHLQLITMIFIIFVLIDIFFSIHLLIVIIIGHIYVAIVYATQWFRSTCLTANIVLILSQVLFVGLTFPHPKLPGVSFVSFQ